MRDPNRRYCPQHQREEWKRHDQARGSAAERGYDAAWREIRDRYLADHPMCERCKRRPSTMVHHRTPKRQGGSDDPSNLQALCELCHRQVEAAEGTLFGGQAQGEGR